MGLLQAHIGAGEHIRRICCDDVYVVWGWCGGGGGEVSGGQATCICGGGAG